MQNYEDIEGNTFSTSEPAADDQPRMSEIATIANIFFEPGETFADLKRKPRFIVASILIALFITAYGFGLYYKVGEAGMREFTLQQIEKSPQASGMSAADRQNAVDLNMTIQSGVRYALPVVVSISLLIGGLLYFLGAKAFGGNGGFLHGLSVWVYSSLPPTLISMIGSFIVLALKSVEEIDLAASQRGLIRANPLILLDMKDQPVIGTVIGTLDLFMIWGWILAAIGLRITNKLSTGSAWTVVIIFAIVGLFFRLVGAFFSGTPG